MTDWAVRSVFAKAQSIDAPMRNQLFDLERNDISREPVPKKGELGASPQTLDTKIYNASERGGGPRIRSPFGELCYDTREMSIANR